MLLIRSGDCANARFFSKRNIDSRRITREPCHSPSCNGKNERRDERRDTERENEGAARSSLLLYHRQSHPPVANRASIQRPTTFLCSTKKASLGVSVPFHPQGSTSPRSTLIQHLWMMRELFQWKFDPDRRGPR